MNSTDSLGTSAYLRAHKKEPFLWLSLGSGILIAGATWVLGKRFGPTGVAAGYLIAMVIVVLIGTGIWNRCRAKWHL